MSHFSELLRSAIEKSGVPVANIAFSSGISTALLYKYQQGRRMPDSADRLKAVLQAARCSVGVRNELIREYHIARLGATKYRCFDELKGLISDFSTRPQMKTVINLSEDMEIPHVIRGGMNVAAALLCFMKRETALPGGQIHAIMPLDYGRGMECFREALKDCHPEFHRATHLFALRDGAFDDATLHNVVSLRTALPAMLFMERYEPRYCYEPATEVKTELFPYAVITTDGVMLLSEDYESALYTADSEVREAYFREFARLQSNFAPVMDTGPATLERYLREYMAIGDDSLFRQKPLVFTSGPILMSCLRPEAVSRYLEELGVEVSLLSPAVERFLSTSASGGYITIFSMEGLQEVYERGILVEIPGIPFPTIQKKDFLDALEELLQRADRGVIVPYALRIPLFSSDFLVSIGIYGSQMKIYCEASNFTGQMAGILEPVLGDLARSYASYAEELGDFYSVEETMDMLRRFLREEREKLNLLPEP